MSQSLQIRWIQDRDPSQLEGYYVWVKNPHEDIYPGKTAHDYVVSPLQKTGTTFTPREVTFNLREVPDGNTTIVVAELDAYGRWKWVFRNDGFYVNQGGDVSNLPLSSLNPNGAVSNLSVSHNGSVSDTVIDCREDAMGTKYLVAIYVDPSTGAVGDSQRTLYGFTGDWDNPVNDPHNFTGAGWPHVKVLGTPVIRSGISADITVAPDDTLRINGYPIYQNSADTDWKPTGIAAPAWHVFDCAGNYHNTDYVEFNPNDIDGDLILNECDAHHPDNIGFADSDGDGILDICDLVFDPPVPNNPMTPDIQHSPNAPVTPSIEHSPAEVSTVNAGANPYAVNTPVVLHSPNPLQNNQGAYRVIQGQQVYLPEVLTFTNLGSSTTGATQHLNNVVITLGTGNTYESAGTYSHQLSSPTDIRQYKIKLTVDYNTTNSEWEFVLYYPKYEDATWNRRVSMTSIKLPNLSDLWNTTNWSSQPFQNGRDLEISIAESYTSTGANPVIAHSPNAVSSVTLQSTPSAVSQVTVGKNPVAVGNVTVSKSPASVSQVTLAKSPTAPASLTAVLPIPQAPPVVTVGYSPKEVNSVSVASSPASPSNVTGGTVPAAPTSVTAADAYWSNQVLTTSASSGFAVAENTIGPGPNVTLNPFSSTAPIESDTDYTEILILQNTTIRNRYAPNGVGYSVSAGDILHQYGMVGSGTTARSMSVDTTERDFIIVEDPNNKRARPIPDNRLSMFADWVASVSTGITGQLSLSDRGTIWDAKAAGSVTDGVRIGSSNYNQYAGDANRNGLRIVTHDNSTPQLVTMPDVHYGTSSGWQSGSFPAFERKWTTFPHSSRGPILRTNDNAFGPYEWFTYEKDYEILASDVSSLLWQHPRQHNGGTVTAVYDHSKRSSLYFYPEYIISPTEKITLECMGRRIETRTTNSLTLTRDYDFVNFYFVKNGVSTPIGCYYPADSNWGGTQTKDSLDFTKYISSLNLNYDETTTTPGITLSSVPDTGAHIRHFNHLVLMEKDEAPQEESLLTPRVPRTSPIRITKRLAFKDQADGGLQGVGDPLHPNYQPNNSDTVIRDWGSFQGWTAKNTYATQAAGGYADYDNWDPNGNSNLTYDSTTGVYYQALTEDRTYSTASSNWMNGHHKVEMFHCNIVNT